MSNNVIYVIHCKNIYEEQETMHHYEKQPIRKII